MIEAAFNITTNKPTEILKGEQGFVAKVYSMTACNTSVLPMVVNVFRFNNQEPQKTYHFVRDTTLGVGKTLVINNFGVELDFKLYVQISQGTMDVTLISNNNE